MENSPAHSLFLSFLFVDFEGILDLLGEHEMLVYTLNLSDVIGSLDLSVGVHQYTIGTVYVTVFVIPDVPLGTLATILAMFGALGLCKTKTLRSKIISRWIKRER